MEAAVVPSLPAMLGRIPDPRKARGRRHPWPALLLLIVAALLAGANSQRAIARWAADLGRAGRSRLGCTRPAPPSEPTLRRALQRVNLAQLERALGAWQQALHAAGPAPPAGCWLDGIAIDGKKLRGARRRGVRPGHLLGAYSVADGLVLGQAPVPAGTDEVGALAALLDAVPVAGETVTLDALFTRADVARALAGRGAAYLMVVKGNTPFLRRCCREATTLPLRRPTRQHGTAATAERGHGRVEERTLRAADALDIPWPHARQVLRLDRHVEGRRADGRASDETVYALTSLPPERAGPADLLRLWRGHWGVENRLHWVRDADLLEDRAATRTGTAPEALAAFRNLAVALLRRWRGPRIAAGRDYYAHHPAVLLRRLTRPVLRL